MEEEAHAVNDHLPEPVDTDRAVAAIKKVLSDAHHGREGSHEALRELFDESPQLALMTGDVALRAEAAVLKMMPDGGFLGEESAVGGWWMCDRSWPSLQTASWSAF